MILSRNKKDWMKEERMNGGGRGELWIWQDEFWNKEGTSLSQTMNRCCGFSDGQEGGNRNEWMIDNGGDGYTRYLTDEKEMRKEDNYSERSSFTKLKLWKQWLYSLQQCDCLDCLNKEKKFSENYKFCEKNCKLSKVNFWFCFFL